MNMNELKAHLDKMASGDGAITHPLLPEQIAQAREIRVTRNGFGFALNMVLAGFIVYGTFHAASSVYHEFYAAHMDFGTLAALGGFIAAAMMGVVAAAAMGMAAIHALNAPQKEFDQKLRPGISKAFKNLFTSVDRDLVPDDVERFISMIRGEGREPLLVEQEWMTARLKRHLDEVRADDETVMAAIMDRFF